MAAEGYQDRLADVLDGWIEARDDPDRLSEMIGTTSRLLGYAIAGAVYGDREAIDKLIPGMEAEIHRSAVRAAEFTAALKRGDGAAAQRIVNAEEEE